LQRKRRKKKILFFSLFFLFFFFCCCLPPPKMAALREGLCGCHRDPGACLLGTFFPCALLAWAGAALEGRRCDVLDCVCPPSLYQVRQTLRARTGAPRAPCADCAAATLCPCLAVCREAREVKRGFAEAVRFLPDSGARGAPQHPKSDGTMLKNPQLEMGGGMASPPDSPSSMSRGPADVPDTGADGPQLSVVVTDIDVDGDSVGGEMGEAEPLVAKSPHAKKRGKSAKSKKSPAAATKRRGRAAGKANPTAAKNKSSSSRVETVLSASTEMDSSSSSDERVTRRRRAGSSRKKK
jgi:Cys-rich protein (TIGR01571 family)